MRRDEGAIPHPVHQGLVAGRRMLFPRPGFGLTDEQDARCVFDDHAKSRPSLDRDLAVRV